MQSLQSSTHILSCEIIKRVSDMQWRDVMCTFTTGLSFLSANGKGSHNMHSRLCKSLKLAHLTPSESHCGFGQLGLSWQGAAWSNSALVNVTCFCLTFSNFSSLSCILGSEWVVQMSWSPMCLHHKMCDTTQLVITHFQLLISN